MARFRSDRLVAVVVGVPALGLRQRSISLPHEVTVVQHLDEVDETARRIGAVDTAVLPTQRLAGNRTDALGAARALEGDVRLSGARAVVLGARGSARTGNRGMPR